MVITTTTGEASVACHEHPDSRPDQIATVTPLPTAAGPVPVRATYTVPEVAALLGISRATAYALLATGEIPARRIGSRWIIARRRFDTWLNEAPPSLPTGTEQPR